MKHEQIPITPPTKDCWCGAKAHVIDWDFRGMYRVMCDKNHTLTQECITVHRAICRWNNRVEEKLEKMNLKERMSNITESVLSWEDREQLKWLLANAWTNMRTFDDHHVHMAYTTIICEIVPVLCIVEVRKIMDRAWADTEAQREGSLKP